MATWAVVKSMLNPENLKGESRMTIQEEIREAARAGRSARYKAYKDLTPKEQKKFRKDRRDIQKRQTNIRKTVGKPSEYSRTKIFTAEERAARQEAAKERKEVRDEKRRQKRMALYFDALSARDLAKVKRKKEQEERRTEKRSAREKREAVIEQLHKISEMEESPSGSLEDPRYRPNIVAREHITADRPSGISTPIKGVAIAKGCLLYTSPSPRD
mgnify:FL=1